MRTTIWARTLNASLIGTSPIPQPVTRTQPVDLIDSISPIREAAAAPSVRRAPEGYARIERRTLRRNSSAALFEDVRLRPGPTGLPNLRASKKTGFREKRRGPQMSFEIGALTNGRATARTRSSQKSGEKTALLWLSTGEEERITPADVPSLWRLYETARPAFS